MRQAFRNIPRSSDYFNDMPSAYNTLSNLEALQAAGVNRDIISRVLNNEELARLLLESENALDLFQKLTPSQAEAFVRVLPSILATNPERGSWTAVVTRERPIHFLQQAADIDDEVLRDTYLGILPEWEGKPEEALETARMLVDLGD